MNHKENARLCTDTTRVLQAADAALQEISVLLIHELLEDIIRVLLGE